MMKKFQPRWAIAVGIVAVILYTYDYIQPLITVIGYTSAITLGLSIGMYVVLFTGEKYHIQYVDEPAGKVLQELMAGSRMDSSHSLAGKRQHSIFNRNIDAAIDELLDLALRDFVLSWLADTVDSPLDVKDVTDGIKDDLWFAIESLKERLAKIDEVKFLTHDVAVKVCQHYQRIRQASFGGNGKERKSATFLLKPYLASSETETEFLRKISEVVIILLGPRSYAQCVPVRHLFREVLTCSVFYPTINFLCDPDYINRKLLSYLHYHQEMMEQHKRTYAYAATYEGFVKMIQECTNLEQLKHVRYNIMTEIMQATTINNLKKSKGIDLEKDVISQSTSKGDLLQARNLELYINQLTFAKSTCERRIKLLGGGDYSCQSSQLSAAGSEDDQHVPDSKVLSHEVIMDSDFARSFFMKFLAREDCQFLLEFYVAVEELKECDKKKLHHLANEIYQGYIPYVSSTVKLDRSILKGMEAFLMGNKGPEAFVEAQEEVYKYLEERYYPSFIVSDVYCRMMKDAVRVGVEFDQGEDDDEIDEDAPDAVSTISQSADGSAGSVIPLSDHSSFARAKLEQLEEKLSNKLQAWEAMKITQCAEAKVVGMLEKEIDSIKSEKRALSLHIERTEAWCENLGRWRVQVHSVEMVEEKEKTVPHYLLVVHLDDSEVLTPIEDENDIQEDNEKFQDNRPASWVVKRRISEFISLGQKLAQIGSWVKTVELPKERKLRPKGSDRLPLDRIILMLQNFLDLLLKDEVMNKSETLYSFLSPSPEHLKCVPSPKKSKFFFSTLFKSNQSNSQGEANEDDELLLFDDLLDSSLKDDRIAEPLYNLLGEIFDMRGLSMLLRRTLISFVQITFGRTINRQLRDTVSWLFSESMVVYYFHLLRDSLWPDGKIYQPQPSRSDQEKLQTRNLAKQQFLNNIPEILSNLVGQQNARKGARKVFESLQDSQLNKQLVYELFEMLILEIFPEIKA